MIPRLPYRGVIFDLDGTVYLGERLLPGKARPYAVLGVPHYWLVNIEARRIEYSRAEQGEEAVPLLERADRHAESIGFAYGHALVITILAEATLADPVAHAAAVELYRDLGMPFWIARAGTVSAS